MDLGGFGIAKPKKTKKKERRVSYECPSCLKRVSEGVITQKGKRVCPNCLVVKSKLVEIKKGNM